MASSDTDPRLILLAEGDSVYVLAATIRAGERFRLAGAEHVLPVTVGLGHKIAARPASPGEKILKYGAPIGSATVPIAAGEHVHLHNMQSDYTPSLALEAAEADR